MFSTHASFSMPPACKRYLTCFRSRNQKKRGVYEGCSFPQKLPLYPKLRKSFRRFFRWSVSRRFGWAVDGCMMKLSPFSRSCKVFIKSLNCSWNFRYGLSSSLIYAVSRFANILRLFSFTVQLIGQLWHAKYP